MGNSSSRGQPRPSSSPRRLQGLSPVRPPPLPPRRATYFRSPTPPGAWTTRSSALGWFASLGHTEIYHHVIREDRPLLPRRAIREALVNAVAHRDYAVTGPRVLLESFTNRIAVTSPGPLPNHMQIDSARAGANPRSRNELLANFMLVSGFLELREGMAVDACRDVTFQRHRTGWNRIPIGCASPSHSTKRTRSPSGAFRELRSQIGTRNEAPAEKARPSRRPKVNGRSWRGPWRIHTPTPFALDRMPRPIRSNAASHLSPPAHRGGPTSRKWARTHANARALGAATFVPVQR